MHVRSPCSENDISKLWKYDVLKTEAEIAFYSVNIEEKAWPGTGDFANQDTSHTGLESEKVHLLSLHDKIWA